MTIFIRHLDQRPVREELLQEHQEGWMAMGDSQPALQTSKAKAEPERWFSRDSRVDSISPKQCLAGPFGSPFSTQPLASFTFPTL